MPDVRTVVHRDIHFIDTTKDGHRVTIAKGVKDGKYHGLEASGHNKQKAYDNLLELREELDRVAVTYGLTEEELDDIEAFQAQPVVQERNRRLRKVLDRLDGVETWEVPEYCPGPEDPRCKSECTISLIDRNEDGQYKIHDPDCFR